MVFVEAAGTQFLGSSDNLGFLSGAPVIAMGIDLLRAKAKDEIGQAIAPGQHCCARDQCFLYLAACPANAHLV
jgi:hypothetical protein